MQIRWQSSQKVWQAFKMNKTYSSNSSFNYYKNFTRKSFPHDPMHSWLWGQHWYCMGTPTRRRCTTGHHLLHRHSAAPRGIGPSCHCKYQNHGEQWTLQEEDHKSPPALQMTYLSAKCYIVFSPPAHLLQHLQTTQRQQSTGEGTDLPRDPGGHRALGSPEPPLPTLQDLPEGQAGHKWCLQARWWFTAGENQK